MKRKGLIIALIAIAAVAGLAVLILWKRKKAQAKADELNDKSVGAPVEEPDSAQAPVQTPSPSIVSNGLASIAANIGSVFSGNTVTFDANERSITVEGQKYIIPSRDRVKDVQRNLIEGFESYAKNAGNTADKLKYLGLAKAMKAATRDGSGIDGVIGKATANAFAEAAKLMPSVVKVFKV